MKLAAITLRIALLLGGTSLAHSQAVQPRLQGDWIGQINFGKEWQRINFHFTSEQEGTLDLPQQGRNGLALKKVVLDLSHLTVEWEGRSGLATYDAQIKDDVISGEFKQGQTKGAFRLVRVATALADLKLYNQYAGSYKLGTNRFLDLAPFSEDEDRPIFFDSKTRRTGILYAVSDTEFFSGPSYGVMFPIDLRVSFVKNKQGEVTGLRWQERDSPTITAQRIYPYRQEEIAFTNGDVTLRGTLTMPATKGPHPAIILVHGSGPERRPGGHWTHFFARHGIAYFYFDKRGAGASTGDLNNAGIEDLAGDVLSAVQKLISIEGIDPRQIGLIGHSNGGWVAPLAASRSRDIAFLIVKSGSGLPVHKNIVYELEMDMRATGSFSENDIAHAKALREQLNNALLTNTGWEALTAAIDKSKNERWFGYARVQWLPHVSPPLDSETNPFLRGLRRQIDFDPTTAWENVRCPVLVLLGQSDANVPSKLSAAIIESGLKKSGNNDYVVRILPKANHGLFEAETGYSTESPRLTRYVPGYMDGIMQWLLKRVDVKR
jgi:uncharacterized protein